MTIRLARPDDVDAWLLLWRGYQVFYQTRIPDADRSEFVQYRKML